MWVTLAEGGGHGVAPASRGPQEDGDVSHSTSHFTPIADYGFLSDCHTGVLIAPDGSVDWLSLPAFDSASGRIILADRLEEMSR